MENKVLLGVKIARVSTVAFFVETQLRSQIERVASAGASVIVVASENKLSQPIADTYYQSIEIPRRINLVKDLVALVLLWRFFIKEKIKIVHSTTPKAGLLCCLAGIFARVDIRIHTFTGQAWVGSSGLNLWLAKLADWLVSRLNTRCFSDSRSQCSFLVESGVVRVGSVGVIGAGSLAGVDLARFRSERFDLALRREIRRSIGVSEASFVILFVGRCTRDKGVGELITAFSKLLQRGLDISLVLVGPFEDDAQEIIDQTPAEIRARVICTGFSHCPEQYMAVADVLAIPSYREGFGTVVIEAAAMGLPAVGSDIYGLKDAIADGETGVLVPSKDSDKLAEALLSLYQNPERRAWLGKNARNRACSLFSSDRVNALVVEEYARLLADIGAAESL